MSAFNISIEDVRQAAERIGPYIHRTPVLTCGTLEKTASLPEISLKLFMKCENFQKVGAFKIRGATNAVLSLLSESGPGLVSSSGLTVITHSSGNHAQALAYAAQTLGVSCEVVMPSNSAQVKKDAVRGYGAIVTECVPTLQAREDTTNTIIKDFLVRASSGGSADRIVLVPPYDDTRIITGQGTIVLELFEQVGAQPLDILITPVGGGGMLSGCALVAKSLNPKVWVIGAEPEGADDAARSFYRQNFVPSVNPNTIADGLRTSLGTLTYPLILKYVDAIHTVSDREIIRAMKLVYERMKIVIEPSSAVTLAVILYSTKFRDSLAALALRKGSNELNIGLVFSGGNVDFSTLSALFATA